MPDGVSPIFCFELKGGYEACVKLVEGTKIFSHAASIGEVASLIIHPASTTHKQLNEEQLMKAEISSSTVRLSVGIEDVNDLIEDLKAGLE